MKPTEPWPEWAEFSLETAELGPDNVQYKKDIASEYGEVSLRKSWLAVCKQLETLSAEMAEIVGSGMVTRGRELRQFEEAAAAHLRVKHAVAISSCTSGLMLTYQALDLKGEFIVPSFTFMSTISSAVWAGLRPILIDVEERTHNLDP